MALLFLFLCPDGAMVGVRIMQKGDMCLKGKDSYFS